MGTLVEKIDTFSKGRSLFKGVGNPRILVLEGIRWGTARIHGMVIGSTWSFEADGAFVFYPAAGADFRDDIYPISGTYSESADFISFQAARRASLSASRYLSLLPGLVRTRGGCPARR